MANQSDAHSRLVNEILIEISKNPRVRAGKAIVGVFRDLHSERIIKVGTPGMADINGIVGPNGLRLEIEVKTGSAGQNKDQKNYQRMIETRGGLYVLARSVDDVLEAIK